MARSLRRRECFRHLSCYAMATLAAHDPGHGVHPWSWMKTRRFSWLQRALHRRSSSRVWARALAWVQGRSTIMTGQIPKGSGETSQLYPCIGSSTQECHGEARDKQTTTNCTLPKTSVPEELDTPSSPGNAKEGRQMPVVTGKKKGR